VSYAKLFEFQKAADLLEKLTAARPGDVEAWRLLGESALLGQQPARAVGAYEKAAALRYDDLQIQTGLADARIAEGAQGAAVEALLALRSRVAASPPARAGAPAPAPSTFSSPATFPDAGPAPDVRAGAPSASKPAAPPPAQPARPQRAPLDAVSVELLLAKVYGAWRGHDAEALATYDRLTREVAPEDFRGFLARGVFLKERGRRADADRMFLQARFLAPASRQGFVQQMAGANPVLDELPDNDG